MDSHEIATALHYCLFYYNLNGFRVPYFNSFHERVSVRKDGMITLCQSYVIDTGPDSLKIFKQVFGFETLCSYPTTILIR